MKTRYYTVAARRVTVNSTAPAFDQPLVRQVMCLPRQASDSAKSQGQVIDLAAWKQAHGEQIQEVTSAPTRPSSRPLWYGEWAATLAVVCTMAVLMWRILVA